MQPDNCFYDITNNVTIQELIKVTKVVSDMYFQVMKTEKPNNEYVPFIAWL